jgi:hypothetical protein
VTQIPHDPAADVFAREYADLAGVSEPERTAMALRAVELDRAFRSGAISRDCRRQGSHVQRRPVRVAATLREARRRAARALGVRIGHMSENACSFGHGYRSRLAIAKRYAACALGFGFGCYVAASMLGVTVQAVRVMVCELGRVDRKLRDDARALGMELLREDREQSNESKEAA